MVCGLYIIAHLTKMLGAIIGDLAAWTWDNDHECFYPQLVSPQARLSEYGRTLLITANALLRDKNMPIDEYRKMFPFDGYGFYLDDGWIYVYRSGFLLHRFQLQQSKDGLWNIIHLQRSEASQSSSVADITNALYVCE